MKGRTWRIDHLYATAAWRRGIRRAGTVVPASMAVALDETIRSILDGRNFATIATINADGSPQSSVMWVARHGDAVLFSTTSKRLKARNIARDPRVAISVFDIENPYRSAEIRGTAELIEDPQKSLPKELSQKYLGQDPPNEPADEVRLIVRVTPEKIRTFAV